MRRGRVASGRSNQLLAFVDSVWVRDKGIGGGEAGPDGGAAQVGLCEGPEGVALADLDSSLGAAVPCSAWRRRGCDGGGKIDMGARANLVRIGDPGIDGKEFEVEIAVAEILLRQLPERIAGLDADGAMRCDRGGLKSGLRLRRAN